jgi:hypothetical protein
MGFNKVKEKYTKKAFDQRRCGKVMKQNEKFDEQMGINASNLLSTKLQSHFSFTN